VSSTVAEFFILPKSFASSHVGKLPVMVSVYIWQVEGTQIPDLLSIALLIFTIPSDVACLLESEAAQSTWLSRLSRSRGHQLLTSKTHFPGSACNNPQQQPPTSETSASAQGFILIFNPPWIGMPCDRRTEGMWSRSGETQVCHQNSSLELRDHHCHHFCKVMGSPWLCPSL
jgi:hypothetical protein